MDHDYLLMHKNSVCGILKIDADNGAVIEYKPEDKNYSPFLGNADLRLMKIWWKHRAVPGSRSDMAAAIRRAGCDSNALYLAKNLALSLTDCYWICPAEVNLRWDDVKLYESTTDIGGDCDENSTILAYHNGTSYDPNASLGGQMSKCWNLSTKRPLLVKKAYEHYGQQSINEIFASKLHELQNTDISHVVYEEMKAEDNAVISCCESFTSEQIEFVPAYEVLRSRKLRNNRSDFDQFLDICAEHGIDREVMHRFMDYMLLSDFVISNTDRHLQNFGLLRNTDTMELIGPAPIFDCGNSMFFNLDLKRPLSRIELLEQEISSFHRSEEKMLKHIADRRILDMDKLPASADVEAFYAAYDFPDARAEAVACSYENKLQLLNEFQHGKTISLYREKAAL